jgi:hypothetical protein
MTTASESAGCQIQNNKNVIIKILYRFKGKLVFNPNTESDVSESTSTLTLYSKSTTMIMLGQSHITEKHSYFSSQRVESQKVQIEIKLITNL